MNIRDGRRLNVCGNELRLLNVGGYVDLGREVVVVKVFGRDEVGHIDLVYFVFSQESAAGKAFARNFRRLRDVHKRLRIALFDNVFDTIDLLFGCYAKYDVVFLARVITDGFGYRYASMEFYGELVGDGVRLVGDNGEYKRGHQARFHYVAHFGLSVKRYKREENG